MTAVEKIDRNEKKRQKQQAKQLTSGCVSDKSGKKQVLTY